MEKVNNKIRQSNIELLRILAMFMVLAVHVNGVSLGLPEPGTSWSCSDWVKTVVESFTILGVNLFVLISGYFGIKLNQRRLINYIAICAVYSVGLYALACIVKPSTFTVENTINSLLVFSKSDLWFIREYLFLMLLSPFLNAGMERLDRRSSDYLFVVMVLINCYFGWLLDCSVNPTGYNLMQLIFMYVCGNWISRRDFNSKVAIALYFVATSLIIMCATQIPFVKTYAYNSPLVVAASMSLFIWFRNLNFTSRWVNGVAANTFAVYIIHKNPYLWGGFINPFIRGLATQYSGPVLTALCTAFVVVSFVVCILVDKIRASVFRLLHIR